MAYIFDGTKGETPETVAHKRKLAETLAARIFGRMPQNVGEGLSTLGQAWVARTMLDEANEAQKAGSSAGNDAFSKISGMITGGQGFSDAGPVSPVSPVASAAPGSVQVLPADQFNSIDAMADLSPETQAKMGVARGAVAGIESGGNYHAVGPAIAQGPMAGQRAVGAYQVMEGNVAPWTKEVMGKAMTPQEFAANQDAQDAVFNGKFGGYMDKYGTAGATRAWHAGEGGMNNPNAQDQLGTKSSVYGQRVAAAVDGDGDRLPPNARPSQAQRQAGPSTQDLIAASTNPWLTESQRGVVNTMLKQRLEQEQQANDPLRQLQIRKAQADLEYGKSPESVREFEYAKKNGYDGSFQDWIASKRAGAGEYGLNAIWGRGPDGKPAIIQLGKGGKPILTPMPEGFQPNKDAEKVDLGTHWGILDPTTRTMVSTIPKDLRGKEREEAIGKGEGEAVVSLESINSKMPGLERVIADLDKLSDEATYTLAGQGMNWGMRQLGFEPSNAAVARTKYISMVDNQVLPLLRDTFGAAFTKAEGDSLRNTLGDPNKSPTEKKAVLNSFIEQKRRDVEGLQRRVGNQGKPPAKLGGNTTSSGVTWSVD